jgi:glycosyltransferase involved in cell wall biosynthesis
MTFLAWLGLAIFLAYLLAGLDLALGNRRVVRLRDVSVGLPAVVPRVSVIVAARNEARNIRAALATLLHFHYPDYEVIVVDDRSTDATGAILDEVASGNPRLRVVHVDELPAGWLGKNHALWVGSRRATGDLLLFTDADIVMAPSVLARAVVLLQARRLDHLAITPAVQMPGLFLNMFGAAFILFFGLFTRPWKASDPKSRCHIGIGAFNLVRASAYRAVGGHETIRLRPDDDMKLGKILKLGGFRQDVAYGAGLLQVEWYASVGELVRGLEKNAFAGADYRISLVLAGVAFHSVASVWPYAALFVTHGVTRAIYAVVVCLITLVFVDSVRFHRASGWYAIGFPLTTLLFLFILLRTMLLNLIQGGIRWRGTFYPLRELKANRV